MELEKKVINSNKTGKLKNSEAKKTESNLLATFFLKYGVVVLLFGLFILFSFMQPRFATTRNVFRLVGQGSLIGLLALGLTNIVVVGEFDISFAATAAICSIISIILIGGVGLNLFLAWGISIGLGVAISILNAINIIYIGIPSLIATLAMMGLLLGVSKWITGGAFIYYAFMPAGFSSIGRGMVGGFMPFSAIFFLIGALIVIIILDYTVTGRYFYAVGGSVKAALHTGINIRKTKFFAFLIMGIMVGVTGILMGSMFGTGKPELGENYLLPAITATFLGAVFFKEGLPNALGTVTAAMLLAILSNGMTMMGLPLFIKGIVQGMIFIVSVLIISILKKGSIPGIKI